MFWLYLCLCCEAETDDCSSLNTCDDSTNNSFVEMPTRMVHHIIAKIVEEELNHTDCEKV